jgi:hypothetical protein
MLTILVGGMRYPVYTTKACMATPVTRVAESSELQTAAIPLKKAYIVMVAIQRNSMEMKN